MTNDRTALLTIRVSIEQGSLAPLRASVRHTADVSRGFERTVTFSDAEATLDLVGTWLRQVLSD